MIGVCEPERSKLYRQNCVHLHSLNVSSIVVTELDRNMNWWMSHCSKFSIKPYCVPFLRTVFQWVGACSSWGTVCVAASEQPQWLHSLGAPVLTYVLNCSQHKPKNKYLPLAERMKNFSWGSRIWLEKSPTRPGHSAAAALSILPSTRVVLSEYPRFYANHNNQE